MTIVNQAATREQIRVAVGRNIDAVTLIAAAANGSTTTFLTDDLFGGSANSYKGRRWLGTDDPNDGVDARVTASSVTTNRTTLTLFPAVTSTVLSDTAELWDADVDPEDIHDYINQAIREVTGVAFDPEEDDGTQNNFALHADGRTLRFDIQTRFKMLNQIQYRTKIEAIQIESTTDAWDESVDGDVTASQDKKDYKRGKGSFKMVVATGAAANDILATQKIDAKNIAGMDYVEFWIKSAVAFPASGDLQLLLDDTANCASPVETLDIPALTTDTWTFVRLPLVNPELDTALISVGLKYVTDIGATTIWLNDIKAVLNSTAQYAGVPKHLWGVDPSTRDLVFRPAVLVTLGYSMLKLKGGDTPATLDADGTVCEVDDWYVIARATSLAMRASPKEEVRKDARDWEILAQQAKSAHHLPQNARMVG